MVVCWFEVGFLRVVSLKPIGVVKAMHGNAGGNRQCLSEIVVEKRFAGALDGLSGFSHVFVVFFLHEVSARQRMLLRVHPKGRMDLPLVGVFATRSPMRPNPIGLTLVELVRVEGNVLTVRGLDAFDGSPVLDIKPFRRVDIPENVRFPSWVEELDSEENVDGC